MFKDTYMDIAEGVKVDRELQMLCIKDGDIDTYITKLLELLSLCCYGSLVGNLSFSYSICLLSL